jgi:hypothetical protein
VPAWLVETYWPATSGSPEAADARLREASGRQNVVVGGVVHIPADEMALLRLDAVDEDRVRAVLDDAGLEYSRIVEVVEIES